jgi:hypothetical protein
MAKTDGPQITKRRVTMRTSSLLANGELATTEIVDYVRPNFDGEPEDTTGYLDNYVADARNRWQYVEVSDEPDAGPAGYDGDTTIHPHLIGKTPADFDRYGDASTPANALDEHLEAQAQQSGGSGRGAVPGILGTMLASSVLVRLALLIGITLAMWRGTWLAILSTIEKNAMATAYAGHCTYAALFSTVPTATGGTELTGGSPAYARLALAWGAPTNGVMSAPAVTFNVASGSTVAGGGFFDALTAGNFRDGGSLTSQAFASQGTYALTPTYTQT